jgi:Yip1 domain
MNLIDRVKNILITPKTEWDVINGETATPQSLLTGYVVPLALIAFAGPLLTGILWAGSWGFKYYLITAVVALIAQIVAFYVSAIIIDLLAPSFGAEKNLNKSAQLVAYSGTPSYVAALLSFIPVLGWLIGLAGWAYGIYIMYLGIGPLKKAPEDKKVVYMIVSFIVMIALYFVVVAILGGIIFAAFGFGAMRSGLY